MSLALFVLFLTILVTQGKKLNSPGTLLEPIQISGSRPRQQPGLHFKYRLRPFLSYTSNTRTNLALSGGWNTNESEQNSTNEPGYDDLFVRLSNPESLRSSSAALVIPMMKEMQRDDLNSYKENQLVFLFTANL